MPYKLKLKPGDGLLTIRSFAEDEHPHIVIAMAIVTAISWEDDDPTPVVHTRRIFTTWVGAN